MATDKVSRRSYVKYVGGIVVVAVVAAAGYGIYEATKPPPGPLHLDFTVWNYSVETIKDNADKFMKEYPNIEVGLYDFNWPDYRPTMVKRFTTNTPTDICYDGEDWIEEFASAGWVVPLEDFWDQYDVEKKIADYKNDMAPYARASSTYKGKLYGLPYYADMFNFMYHVDTLKQVGFEQEPKDWDEVLQACLEMKKKGLAKYPFILSYQANNPFDWYVLLTQSYGRGARLFDDALNPVFAAADSPFRQQLQWIVDGINTHEIINPDYIATHETDGQKKMGSGEGAITVLAKYNLAAMNTPGQSPRSGQFRLGLMPGKTHECYGFAKSYNMTKMCFDRGKDAIQAGIYFIEYFGGVHKGQYAVLKRWAVEKGLGFGFLSPFGDPDIAKSIGEFYGGEGAAALIKDQASKAIAEAHPVIYGRWIEFILREALAKALSEEITVDKCVTLMADKWNELKAG